MNKRFLVTGGLGFIGSNLVLELQNRYPNAEIIVYDNVISGSWKNLEGFKGIFLNKTKDIPKVSVNLNTMTPYGGPYTYSSLGPYFDVIFHLGANTDTTDGNLNSHIENNVNNCKDYLASGKQIIYASSASVYGVGATEPSKETDDLKPANAYAFSKVQLENYMQKHYPNNSMGFRFFNVYGPNERHKKHAKSMVTQILAAVKRGANVKLFPNGQQVRDFIYVKDLVDLLIAAAEKPVPGIYNAGYGKSVSFNEIFKWIKTLYPESQSEIEWVKNPYSFFQEFTEARMNKTIETFGWSPKYNLERGVKDYKDLL